MNILVIGASAGGTKAAARLKRVLGASADVLVVTPDRSITYYSCGFSSYLKNAVTDLHSLIEFSPDEFESTTLARIMTETIPISLNRFEKCVTIRNGVTGEESVLPYDYLILACNSKTHIPDIEGGALQNLFTINTPEDAESLKELVASGIIKRATVCGADAEGIRIADALAANGIRATLIESSSHILPGLDADMADYVENYLSEAGIPVLLNDAPALVEGTEKVEKLRTSGRAVKSDLVVFSGNNTPDTAWLKDSGLELADNGAIITDEYLRTNDADIYACGPCAAVLSAVTGKPLAVPSSTADNVQGRLIAGYITNKEDHPYQGVLGTSVICLSGMKIGMTGIGADYAANTGIDEVHITLTADDMAKYLPEKDTYCIRLIAEKGSRRLLGLQITGHGNIEKLVDTAASAISLKATLYDLEDMDLSSSPETSSPIPAFLVAVNVLQNKIDGMLDGGTFNELKIDDSWIVLDAAKTQAIPQLRHIDLTTINEPIEGTDLNDKIAILCPGGRRSYLTENRLRNLGYSDVHSIEGGTVFNYALEETFGN